MRAFVASSEVLRTAWATVRAEPKTFVSLAGVAIACVLVRWIMEFLPPDAAGFVLPFALGSLAGSMWVWKRVLSRSVARIRGSEHRDMFFWTFVTSLIGLFLMFTLFHELGNGAMALDVRYNDLDFSWIALVAFRGVGWILLLRLAFVLPAAVSGEQSSLALAWRWSKGHTADIFVASLPYVAVIAAGTIVFKFANRTPGGFLSPLVLGAVVLEGAAEVLLGVVYAAWYVRLRDRYETWEVE